MVSGSVLVLNRSYQPIHVTSTKRAFTLLVLGAAQAIDAEMQAFDFDSWSQLSAAAPHDAIHTVTSSIRVPRVIVLQLYDRIPRTKVRFSRANIYARDDSTCQPCGKCLPRAMLNLDHVVPRAYGGRTTWENVVCCCVPCNLKKGARTPEQAGMRLLKKPTRPTWTPAFRTPGGKVLYREWLPFLGLADAAYWNAELHD